MIDYYRNGCGGMKILKKVCYYIVFLAACVVFLYSGYQLYLIYSQNFQESKELKEWKEISKVDETSNDSIQLDWKALKEKNSDIQAWIQIPDTEISYPVVQGNDNAFYLTHTADKVENYVGAIFMDYRQKPNFEEKNTMIYGHNVLHGSMFADIEKFKDETFFKNHPYIYIYTPDKNYKAEVFSIYTTQDTSSSYDLFYQSDDEYAHYLQMVQEQSDFTREIRIGANDHIVSLSTCSYERNGQASELRYVLHAKLEELK